MRNSAAAPESGADPGNAQSRIYRVERPFIATACEPADTVSVSALRELGVAYTVGSSPTLMPRRVRRIGTAPRGYWDTTRLTLACSQMLSCTVMTDRSVMITDRALTRKKSKSGASRGRMTGDT